MAPVPGTYVIVIASIDELRRGGGGQIAVRHAWLAFAAHRSHDRRPDFPARVPFMKPSYCVSASDFRKMERTGQSA